MRVRLTHRRIMVALGLALLIGSAWLWLFVLRPARDAQQLAAYPQLPIASDTSALTLRWLGVAGVLIRAGDDAVLIDPYVSRPPGLLRMLRNAPIAPDMAAIEGVLATLGTAHINAVLVSHSHHDHALDAGLIAQRSGALLVGSASTANLGRGAGVAESQLRIVDGDSAPLHIGAFSVRFIRSQHAGATGGAPTGEIDSALTPPARYLDYRQGGTYSILIEHTAGSVLHHGSAGFVPGALAGLHADTVLLGASLVDDAPRYLNEVVDAVGARQVLLMHWDDFTRPLDHPLRPMPLAFNLAPLARAFAARPKLRVMVADVTYTYTLDTPP